LPKLTKVLKKVSGFTCSEVWVWHIVRTLGFTPQKPEVKAKERDEQAIERLSHPADNRGTLPRRFLPYEPAMILGKLASQDRSA